MGHRFVTVSCNCIIAAAFIRFSTSALFHYKIMNKEVCEIVKVRIYRTIILPVVLYGCETWSLTVREEHKLRVKNGAFWDVTPCGSCKNRRFGGT
jgi:hypothetical protein